MKPSNVSEKVRSDPTEVNRQLELRKWLQTIGEQQNKPENKTDKGGAFGTGSVGEESG